ncbi:hypothetical protein ACEU6E_06680 [Halorutilales archaeon Cl-col2-1]
MTEIDVESLPEIDSPIARDTVGDDLVGLYSTDEDGVWLLQIRDWSNRVIESTVFESDRDAVEVTDGNEYQPVETPDDMDDVAYLRELHNKRVERLKDEKNPEAEAGAQP